MTKKLILILVLLYADFYAQSDSSLINVNDLIENILEESESETDDSDLYELIEFYIDNPVDINKAEIKDLSKLPYLDLAGAKLIVSHRKKYGTFFSTNELYSVNGLSDEITTKILPFLSAGNSDPEEILPEYKSVSVKIRNRISEDLQTRKGFRMHNYEGSPLSIYNRINAAYNKYLKVGFLTEKDAGEKSYYDFYSGYINLSDVYGFKNIIIGDYHVHFGQGLALWNSYGFVKGSDAVFPVKKSPISIRPSSSSSENNFFRGAAVQYSWEHAEITGFISGSSRDAATDSVSGNITSLPIDGYHRTAGEMLRQNKVSEKAAGAAINYSFSTDLSAGLLYYQVNFSKPFISSKIFDINGNNFNYYSSYFDLYILNCNLFGEISFAKKSNPAYIMGFKVSPTSAFTYSMLLRNYPVDYISISGNGFGEMSGARSNQFGIYNGIRWRTAFGNINFYYDQFKFPYATYSNPLPSAGNEFMLHFSTRLLRKFETGLRIRINNKGTTVLINGEDKIVRRLKQSYRLEYAYILNDKLRLKTRFEYISVFLKDYNSYEKGYLLYEDIRISPLEGFTLNGRIIFFRTDSFNSAVYEFENAMTGMLSSRGLYGEGARFYAAARYKLSKNFSLSLKYAETIKPKEKLLGSGNQQIDGNIDNRFYLQTDVNF